MRTIFYMIFVILNSACISQEEVIDVTGNWYNYNVNGDEAMSYVESFFDGNVYYYYDSRGLHIGGKYSIEKDKLVLYLNGSTDDEFLTISMESDILELRFDEHRRYFKRIEDNPYSLERFLNKEISENAYFEYGYQKRKLSWNEKTSN